MNASYQRPDKTHWTGRHSDDKAYWHQAVQLIDLIKETDVQSDIAFLGYSCEEGVKRNQGRLGAKDGPQAIRSFLGKLPIHRPDVRISDVGDLVYHGKVELHTFQLQYAGHIARLLRSGVFPIGLGGGHDLSYAHFCGIHEALHQRNKKFGIINFDAHFDLRKEGFSTSGTPFYQILDQFGDHTRYVALGIQQSANTQELFEAAKVSGSSFLPLDACNLPNIQQSLELVDLMAREVDHIYVTVDMDGFSSAYSPGVSAPSPFGLTPDYVLHVLRHLMKTQKVVAMDFAETNPTYDPDGATARLATKLIWEVAQIFDR